MKKKYTQDELWEAYQAGKQIEVSCPWWPKDHWEIKDNVKTKYSFFVEECEYRITE